VEAFDFDAAHRLPNLPRGHKCRRLHGHTYRVEVVLRGEPDERGFVVDYAEIAKAWKPVHKTLDHRYLNRIEGLETPSTEALAPFIARMLVDALPMLVAVRVYESTTTWCEVRTEDL
jgi:6-pyruvoyltetrahydropterin/6-carboxytetrahydropterin synthase